jgi:guanosine-3',5'-bis(diphosphate) 3'-pyrophosphohydrolase
VLVRRFEDILERLEEYDSDADLDLLRRAYVFSAREHRDQKRRSGEPYLVHPLEVAWILADLELDSASIIAGLLHDVVEDTLTTIEVVEQYFGEDVAHIVAGVTKISKLKFATQEHAQGENLRKMIMAMVDDIRVIMVKLADRLHNMRTLKHLAPEKQRRISLETMEIYAPIANRLGMGRVKSALEDLSFQFLEPAAHLSVSQTLKKRRKGSGMFIDEIQAKLVEDLKNQGVQAEISGRIKSLYSIYRKMKAQRIEVDQVYDYVAFRVLTDSVKDCYAALGTVHAEWRPVPGRIKDYIAMPKPNMYQSLHTSVMTDRGQPFEVQIRTREMHRIAEQGIAAHWQYKEGKPAQAGDIDRVNWLRQIMDWQQDLKDPREFLELVKVDLFPEEVYTFTPRGKVLSFPRGATPIDFAYAIHTEVGHKCTGAKVNGKIVPLKYTLQNGDIIEILTQPNKTPNRDWLTIVHTSRARSKIRSWLSTSERAKSVSLGRELTEKDLRKYKLSPTVLQNEEKTAPILRKLGLAALDDFFAAVGYGKVTAHSFVAALVPSGELKEAPEDGRVARAVKRALGLGRRAVKVKGLDDDVLITLGRCCNPVRGEEILGYITRGKGVTVHATHCPNVARLMYDPERRIDVEWDFHADDSAVFNVKLILAVQDRQGLLSKIIAVISNYKANIKDVDAKTPEGRDARIQVVLTVKDQGHLKRVMSGIAKIPGVLDVIRART